jgi:hypothetical protein
MLFIFLIEFISLYLKLGVNIINNYILIYKIGLVYNIYLLYYKTYIYYIIINSE